VTASMELVRELATLQPDVPVFSVHVRTERRTLLSRHGGWSSCATVFERWPMRRITKSHAVTGWLDGNCACGAERDVLALDPRERARGLAWLSRRTKP
jgi:hypothetical protein